MGLPVDRVNVSISEIQKGDELWSEDVWVIVEDVWPCIVNGGVGVGVAFIRNYEAFRQGFTQDEIVIRRSKQ